MAAWKSCLFAGVALALVAAASAKKDLSVHRNVVCKTYRAPKGGAHPIHSSLSSVVRPAVVSVSDKFNVLAIAVRLKMVRRAVDPPAVDPPAHARRVVSNNTTADTTPRAHTRAAAG